MPFSINHKGKVLDFKYKKVQGHWHYAFYIGDILVGQVFRMGKGNWSAVSETPNDLCPVNGFRSRYYASNFLLWIGGYYKKQDSAPIVLCELLPITFDSVERKEGWSRTIERVGTVGELFEIWDIDNPEETSEMAQVLRLLRTAMDIKKKYTNL